jgi:hypothetical protein
VRELAPSARVLHERLSDRKIAGHSSAWISSWPEPPGRYGYAKHANSDSKLVLHYGEDDEDQGAREDCRSPSHRFELYGDA